MVVSPRYRRELTAIVEQSGRSVLPLSNPEEAILKFARSPAMVVIVDARGILAKGLRLARDLAHMVEARRGALIVLLSRNDLDALGDVYRAGATHFLASPFSAQELIETLHFAERYVHRLQASNTRAAVATAQAALQDSARWEWTVGAQSVWLSASLARMLGEASDVGNIAIDDFLNHISPSARREMLGNIRRILRVGVPGELEHELLIDGRPHRCVHHVRPMRDQYGHITGLSAVVEDVDAVLMERRVAAHFDTLTGLANASYARTWVEQLLGGRSHCDPACIVVLMAISRFDQINAGYGRVMADSLLQAVSRRLRRLAGESAASNDRLLLARLAGAEFAIALAGPVNLKEAVFFSQRLGEAFEKPFIVGGRVVHLACRIGIAAGEAELEDADTLFRRASAALAEAKRQEQPNSFQVYLAASYGDTHARLAGLETDIRKAAESGELDILYQPQVDIISNRIVGVEALVRWNHPTFGVLSPEMLLSIAEKAEYSTRLGEQILKQAIEQAAAWPAVLDQLRLSVNITATDMRSGELGNQLAQLLLKTGFPAKRLTLEVTESGLIENLNKAADLLATLRRREIRIAIDDFGTGYSSLAYLKALPLDYIKVDKSLVTDVTGSARDRIVVRGVVDMARSLGLGVIAEGVEDRSQLDSLIREGVNWYQGYLCAPPLTSDELVRFVAEWNSKAKVA